MVEVAEPPQWLERWNRSRIGTAGAVSGIGVLGGILVLPPVGDALAIALATAIGSTAIWAWRKRTELERLPLVLGEVGVRQVVDGRPSLRFRLWLGHGRSMRGIEASGSLCLPSGREIPVPVDVAVDHACGPVTLTAALPPLASGRLTIRATAVAGGRSWDAKRDYDVTAAPLGPLDVPVRRGASGLDWDRSGWDRPLSGR